MKTLIDHGRQADSPDRIYALTDRFLGRALLALCREARRMHPGALARAPTSGSDLGVFLVWDIGPEIAARLGETVFHPQERRDTVRLASIADLRHWAWLCLTHTGPFVGEMDSVPMAGDSWNVIRRDVADGNPVFIALDRLARPVTFDTHGDPAAARVATARLSRGLAPALSWMPNTNSPREGRTFPWRIDGDLGSPA
jgi:hypothetical protein